MNLIAHIVIHNLDVGSAARIIHRRHLRTSVRSAGDLPLFWWHSANSLLRVSDVFICCEAMCLTRTIVS
jgi:hypothetical protein